MFARPILRTYGARFNIQSHILSQFPQKINNYYEPFLGSGNILITLLASHKISGSVRVSDNNPHLIRMYKILQEYPNLLDHELRLLSEKYNSLPHAVPRGLLTTSEFDIVQLKTIPETLENITSREQYYYWVRNRFNSSSIGYLERSAMFIFLNRTCFRGIYREGPSGFDVPYGHYPNPVIHSPNHIQYLSELLRKVIFELSSYHHCSSFLSSKQTDDFVFINTPADFQESWNLYEKCRDLECPFFLCDNMTEFEIMQQIFKGETFKLSEIRDTRYTSIQFVRSSL